MRCLKGGKIKSKMEILSDYVFGKIIQRLEEKVKENPIYQKIIGHIPIISSSNSELNQLIEKSIKIAKENIIVADLQDDEIKKSIDRNIDVITDCIIISKENFPLGNFLLRICGQGICSAAGNTDCFVGIQGGIISLHHNNGISASGGNAADSEIAAGIGYRHV